jgi:hypothetical protein
MKLYIVIPFFSLIITACSTPVAQLDNDALCARLAEGEYFRNNWIWDPAFKEAENREQNGTISKAQCDKVRAQNMNIFAQQASDELFESQTD